MIKKFSLAVVLSLCALYAAFALGQWEVNPGLWPYETRWTLAVLLLISWLLSFVVIAIVESDKGVKETPKTAQRPEPLFKKTLYVSKVDSPKDTRSTPVPMPIDPQE